MKGIRNFGVCMLLGGMKIGCAGETKVLFICSAEHP